MNVALIGAGRIAEVAHLPAWQLQADARVTVVEDAPVLLRPLARHRSSR
jgi:predicted dehydrogenase